MARSWRTATHDLYCHRSVAGELRHAACILTTLHVPANINTLTYLCRTLPRHTSSAYSRMPTCVPSMPSVSRLWQRTCSWPGAFAVIATRVRWETGGSECSDAVLTCTIFVTLLAGFRNSSTPVQLWGELLGSAASQ